MLKRRDAGVERASLSTGRGPVAWEGVYTFKQCSWIELAPIQISYMTRDTISRRKKQKNWFYALFQNAESIAIQY